MMDLQISVYLLFVLFTAGHSLYCYECLSDYCLGKMVRCPFGASMCKSSTLVTQIGDISSKVKVKGCADDCRRGSMNLGVVKMSISCCDSSFCNTNDSPDPRTLGNNGKSCYYCDAKSCSNVMSCSGSEDRCLRATGFWGGQSTVVKGCVSKSICDYLSDTHEGMQCCEGDLCNGEQSVTQSFVHDGDERVFQSVTQGFIQSVSKSIENNGSKRAKRSFAYNNVVLSDKWLHDA